MKNEIVDIKEKLDILMNRLPLEEKKPKIEGKIYFLTEAGQTIDSCCGSRSVKILLRILPALSHEKLHRIYGIYLFRPTIY